MVVVLEGVTEKHLQVTGQAIREYYVALEHFGIPLTIDDCAERLMALLKIAAAVILYCLEV